MALRGDGGCGTGEVDLWGARGRVRVARGKARPGGRRAARARVGGRAARPESVSIVRRRAGAGGGAWAAGRREAADVLRHAHRGPQCTPREDRKSTRLNSSHQIISYAVFCLKKKKK